MSADAYRCERLRRLVDLARAYRGWTNTELAAALGRDARNVYSQSGNPKYDYLRGLARALEWSIEDVARFIEGGAPPDVADGDETFESLNESANRLMAAGRFEEMIEVARKMYVVSSTSEERARACNREANAWTRLGRFEQFLDAIRRGLDQGEISSSLRYVLQSNLAIGYFRIWDLSSANGVAHSLIDRLTNQALPSKREHGALAFAHYVRGHCVRRQLQRDPVEAHLFIERAMADLRIAARLLEELAAKFGEHYAAAWVLPCHAGILELACAAEQHDPVEAADEIFAHVPQRVSLDDYPCADWLEALGWCCIYCANIALRHFTGATLQQKTAIYLNKALECAEPLRNWAIFERAFSLQHDLSLKLGETTGLRFDLTIDEEDMKWLTGTLGRFPRFRELGEAIASSAKVIKGGQ